MEKVSTIIKRLKFKLSGKKELVLDESSQPYVLKERMGGLTHDQTVIADIGPVRISNVDYTSHKAILRFCPTGPVFVKQWIKDGDGGELPDAVELRDFKPIDRKLLGELVMLRGVKLHSNGHIQVIATKDTTIEKY